MRLLKHLRGKKAGSFFSNLLPGGKAKSNLRGVVLFVDISPFVGIPDPARIGGLGRRIQERLRLIGESFGVHFPVYVIFAKTDGVPYFADYFARLADSEDQQILGCTLPILTAAQRPTGEVFAESESARLADAFNQLYYSLADKRTTFLSREPVAARKVPTYEFPREMKRLRDTLVQFLVDVFRPNRLQPSPILRGYYFTGTRQVAASAANPGGVRSVQRAPATGEATSLFNLQDYQKKMGLPAQEAQGEPTVTHWSFVPELFHRVVLADRLDTVAGFRHRKLDLYRRVAFGEMRLKIRLAVPVEAEPFHAIEDRVDRRLGGARLVGVLDPEHEAAAAMARVEPVEQGRAGAADVQEAGRRRRETGDDFACAHARILQG